MNTLTTRPAVLPATLAEEESALAPLVLAFATDPMVRWTWPDAHQFRIFFPRFVRAFGGKAFALGTAQRLEDFRGTALWLPPGAEPDEDALMPLLEETVPAQRLNHIFAIFEQMGALHPAAPHWYLPLLGIDPLHQSLGLGSVLLREMFATFDRDRATAYLEASNPRNVPFYERHGFERRGEIQTGDSPVLVAMVREPR